MLYDSALLLVTRSRCSDWLGALLRFAQPLVRSRLYVALPERWPVSPQTVAQFYQLAEANCRALDVRLLLPSAATPLLLSRRADVLLVDDVALRSELVTQLAQRHLLVPPSTVVCADPPRQHLESTSPEAAPSEEQFGAVAMGGTFDRLHNGHKILLSVAALLTGRLLTVGMTTPAMLAKKQLTSLIEPLPTRIAAVLDFLVDVRPGLQYELTPLSDPFGPPASRPDYQAIVGTADTLAGCAKLNEVRAAAQLAPLQVRLAPELVTPFVEFDALQETKLSSSAGRLRLLGELLRPPLSGPLAGRPYVIGLTGGVAVGKSAVAERLRLLGAVVVNCDALGHEAYVAGSACHAALVRHFGQEIVAPDGGVDRVALGRLVFADADARDQLNALVWPEISRLAAARIAELGAGDVVLLEAAVLLEAGWHMLCNEVWLCLLARDEAQLRVQRRNGLSADAAVARVAAQPQDEERLPQCTVALSTTWSERETQRQVEKAWCLLQQRLPPPAGSKL